MSRADPHSGAGRRRRSGLPDVALNLASVVLGLLLCELLLAVAATLSSTVKYRLSPPSTRLNVGGIERVVPRELVPDPLLNFRFSPHAMHVDQWGYRNEAVPGRCAVLAVGDSMTFGSGVPRHASWPAVLSRMSGQCVYNAGMPSYGPVEYRYVLDETLRLSPTVVVVGLYLGNDLSDAFAVAYTRPLNPLTHLRSPVPEIAAQIERMEREESLVSRAMRLIGAGAEEKANHDDTGIGTWLKTHSNLYALAREIRREVRQASRTMRGAADQGWDDRPTETFESAAAIPSRRAWEGERRFRTVFIDPELMALSMNMDDARIREGQRITQDSLIAMRDATKRAGAVPIVVLIPTKESVYAEKYDPEQTADPEATRHLLVQEARLREELTDFLKDASIASVDVLPPLARALKDGIMPFHESDDIHPNAAGQGVIAMALWEVIRRYVAAPAVERDDG